MREIVVKPGKDTVVKLIAIEEIRVNGEHLTVDVKLTPAQWLIQEVKETDENGKRYWAIRSVRIT